MIGKRMNILDTIGSIIKWIITKSFAALLILFGLLSIISGKAEFMPLSKVPVVPERGDNPIEAYILGIFYIVVAILWLRAFPIWERKSADAAEGNHVVKKKKRKKKELGDKIRNAM